MHCEKNWLMLIISCWLVVVGLVVDVKEWNVEWSTIAIGTNVWVNGRLRRKRQQARNGGVRGEECLVYERWATSDQTERRVINSN